MADAGKVEEMLKDETIQALASLEPVKIDPKKARHHRHSPLSPQYHTPCVRALTLARRLGTQLVTEALEASGNDIDTARQYVADKAADTSRKE